MVESIRRSGAVEGSTNEIAPSCATAAVDEALGEADEVEVAEDEASVEEDSTGLGAER